MYIRMYVHVYICICTYFHIIVQLFYIHAVPNIVGMVDITCAPVDLNNTCTVTWSVSNLINVEIYVRTLLKSTYAYLHAEQ